MNQELNNRDRKNLRKLAHSLKPIVMIGQHGVTAAVMSEIEVALIAHVSGVSSVRSGGLKLKRLQKNWMQRS